MGGFFSSEERRREHEPNTFGRFFYLPTFPRISSAYVYQGLSQGSGAFLIPSRFSPIDKFFIVEVYFSLVVWLWHSIGLPRLWFRHIVLEYVFYGSDNVFFSMALWFWFSISLIFCWFWYIIGLLWLWFLHSEDLLWLWIHLRFPAPGQK